jgi:hypothetical protein
VRPYTGARRGRGAGGREPRPGWGGPRRLAPEGRAGAGRSVAADRGASSSTYSGRPATVEPSEGQPPLGTSQKRDADDAPQRLPSPNIRSAAHGTDLALMGECTRPTAGPPPAILRAPVDRRGSRKGSRGSLLGRGTARAQRAPWWSAGTRVALVTGGQECPWTAAA